MVLVRSCFVFKVLLLCVMFCFILLLLFFLSLLCYLRFFFIYYYINNVQILNQINKLFLYFDLMFLHKYPKMTSTLL